MPVQVVPPSVEYWRTTDPVGTPSPSVPGELIDTVAVAMNDWPETELKGARATAVVVGARFTTWVTGVTEVDG
jgi:hypothetical protein